MEFNFGSRSAPRHGTERERERSNPVRFLASQRTVIECKCNNRVATYYLRKPYFVFRVVIPLHSSSLLPRQTVHLQRPSFPLPPLSLFSRFRVYFCTLTTTTTACYVQRGQPILFSEMGWDEMESENGFIGSHLRGGR